MMLLVSGINDNIDDFFMKKRKDEEERQGDVFNV